MSDPFYHIARAKQDRAVRQQKKLNGLGPRSRIKPLLCVLVDDTAYIDRDNQLIRKGKVVRRISNKLISLMNMGGYIRWSSYQKRWLPIW